MQVVADADIVIWIIFAAEYVIRLALAPHKFRFVWSNPLDLVVVAVPVLRPLRLARLARLARVGVLTGLASRQRRARLHVDTAIQVVLVAAVIVFVGAVGMLDVERNAPGSNIHTFGDALWWALATVTTVGYGDRFPVTGQGRLIGAAVMITGIAV
ncbi:MAG: ion transporter, partial [Acidimicrobiaceae bacterium]|nr:ion transporter [Acidimicrobiaceae bacterium]